MHRQDHHAQHPVAEVATMSKFCQSKMPIAAEFEKVNGGTHQKEVICHRHVHHNGRQGTGKLRKALAKINKEKEAMETHAEANAIVNRLVHLCKTHTIYRPIL